MTLNIVRKEEQATQKRKSTHRGGAEATDFPRGVSIMDSLGTSR